MKDPLTTVQTLAESTTTGRFLACLVIGNASAYLLRSANPFTFWLTIAFLVLMTSVFTLAGYVEYRTSQDEQPPPEHSKQDKTNTKFYNALLVFLLFMTLSLWF